MDFDFALNRSSEERQVSIILERIGSLQEVVGSPHPTLPRCLALQRSDIVIGAWNHRVAFIQDPALAVSGWLDCGDLMAWCRFICQVTQVHPGLLAFLILYFQLLSTDIIVQKENTTNLSSLVFHGWNVSPPKERSVTKYSTDWTPTKNTNTCHGHMFLCHRSQNRIAYKSVIASGSQNHLNEWTWMKDQGKQTVLWSMAVKSKPSVRVARWRLIMMQE